jgi:3-hydroxyisobutyrate dehydrogenase-like beta-hydroxyacid dehydrogenase
LGSSLKLKALNQVNCGINITAASEIMGLAAVLGLDTQKFYDGIKSAEHCQHGFRQGVSWMLLDRGARILTATPKMSSATGITVKDVGIILDEAR